MKARARSTRVRASVRHGATRGSRRGAARAGKARARRARPTGGGLGGRKVLNAQVPQQEADNWCWAAVASGVASFFGDRIPQCEVASRTLRADCCTEKGPCDVKGQLDRALEAVGHYRDFAKGALPLRGVAAEIDQGAPLGAYIQWRRDDGGHFVLIDGYDADEGLVVVRDPATSEGPQWTPIEEVESAYRSGAGYWSHTYWVQ